MARLCIALLGSCTVTFDGQPVTSLRYDKVRALLAYLAVERHRSHGRSALAALFWPDAAECDARKSLRNALATLRQIIGDTTAEPPFLLITRDTVQFNPAADVRLDVTMFDALLCSLRQHHPAPGILCAACANRYQQAIELYRGDFLDQIVVPDSLAWDEWVVFLRERLHRQMLDALAQLVAYHEHQGAGDTTRRYAWRALALEPWNEEMHRCLMQVQARDGQRGAALAQYERCRHILVKELGVEPAAETTRLYERICAGPLEKIVGTAPAMNPNGQAVAVAGWKDMHILSLTDAPVGGTARLGLAITRMRQDDPDSLCFVALVPVRDPALMGATMMQAARIGTAGARGLAARLQEYLRDKALRLVLDNFAWVLDDMVGPSE